jgi:uncharacterized protein YecE (DUF72 family)
MAQIRLGTCSWKFPSWAGLVYSAARGIDYLEEYAQRYDTVEIDQWFWSRFGLGEVKLPDPEDVAAYRAVVPDGFRFTIKAPNSVTLTHLYQQDKGDPLVDNPSFLSSALMETFLDLIEPLRDVLGPIMFQFEYLNRQKMTSQTQFERRMLAFVQQLPAGYPYALEVRNGQYMNETHFSYLHDARLIPVLIQGYWMPPLWEVYAAHRESIRRHHTVVLRLMGPDRQAIEGLTGKHWDRLAAPKDEELPRIAEMAQDLMRAGTDVYINVNNHYEGSAPLTIQRLQGLLLEIGQ